jgi:hypothetical protein
MAMLLGVDDPDGQVTYQDSVGNQGSVPIPQALIGEFEIEAPTDEPNQRPTNGPTRIQRPPK